MYFRCSKQEQGEQHGILDMMVSFPDLMSANKTNYYIERTLIISHGYRKLNTKA